MDSYKKAKGQNVPNFNLGQILMSQLRKVITSMRPTLSTAGDQIPMKIIKEARTVLEPQLLNLVNKIIETAEYPQILKVKKTIPIPKPPMDVNIIEGWIPINLVPTISKVVEKCILAQLLEHAQEKHGSVHNHSTQTLLIAVLNTNFRETCIVTNRDLISAIYCSTSISIDYYCRNLCQHQFYF